LFGDGQDRFVFARLLSAFSRVKYEQEVCRYFCGFACVIWSVAWERGERETAVHTPEIIDWCRRVKVVLNVASVRERLGSLRVLRLRIEEGSEEASGLEVEIFLGFVVAVF